MASRLIEAGLLDYCCGCRMANSGNGGFLNAAFESFGNGFISCRDQADVSWIGCRARVMDCCETTGRLDLLKSPVANQNNNIFQVIHHLGNRLDAFYWGHLELFGAFWVRCEKNHKKPTFVGDFFRETHSIPSHFLGHFSMN